MCKKLVDIGSKTLEVCIKGAGEPVIVIETGMGCSMAEWSHIIDELSKTTTVLTYHRAGYGRSTIDFTVERTFSNITDDLNILLEKEGISENIVLVGHSFGGLCIQHYAKKYSDRVKSLVMIDASPSEYFKLEDLKGQLAVINEKYNTKKMIDQWDSLALKSQEELGEGFFSNPNLYKSLISEFKSLVDSRNVHCTPGRFLSTPIKVLVRDDKVEINKLVSNGVPKEEAEKFENRIQQLIEEQVYLSDNGEIIKANNCGHNIFKDNPELVISSVENVLKEISIDN